MELLLLKDQLSRLVDFIVLNAVDAVDLLTLDKYVDVFLLILIPILV